MPPVAPPASSPEGPRRPTPTGPPTFIGPGPGTGGTSMFPPSLPSPPPRRRSHVSGGTIAVLAVMTVVLALLAGYAVAGLRQGPDEPDRIGPEDLPATTADRTMQSSTTVSPGTGTTAPTTQPGGDVPRDLEAFCRSGREVVAFDARLAAAEAGERFDLLAGFVVSERRAWDEQVRALASASPPDVTGDVFQYVLVHRALFDAVQASADYEELRSLVDLQVVASAATWADRIEAAVEASCS